MNKRKFFTGYFDGEVSNKKRRIFKSRKDLVLDDVMLGDDNISQQENTSTKTNSKIFYYLGFIVLMVISFKLFDLQLIKGDYYLNLSKGNRIRYEIVRASRGIIFDSKDKPLVKNIANFSVIIEPFDLPENSQERENLYDSLSSDLEINKEEIKKLIPDLKERVFLEPKIIKENLNQETALKIKMKYEDFPAVVIEATPSREYFDQNSAHVLGYIGRISENEYLSRKEKYDVNDYIGKSGLEQSYEEYLKGQNGKRMVEVDAQGRVVRILGDSEQSESKMGNNIVTSLDQGLQSAMTTALAESIKNSAAKSGSVIAVNPQNGNILGMVSLPSFDNNLFAKGIKSETYQSLVNDPQKPLFNRAVSGTFEPGSTIKPVIAAAGLEEKVITTSTTVNSIGRLIIKNQYDPSIEYVFKDWRASGHGITNVNKAIADSVNTFFYYVGGGYENFKGLGASRLEKYLRLFGLGQKTGIDLNNEATGLVPNPDWKKQVKNEGWYTADNYQLAIGQGALLVTPLQVANYLSTIANGGTMYKPRLVTKITDNNNQTIKELKSKIIKKDFISKEALDVVRKGMRETVLSGSAKSLASLPFSVAGKTGTAQYGPNNSKQHAWFTAFAPYENPEIALVVLVEGGGEGSIYAVPVARQVLEYYFANK